MSRSRSGCSGASMTQPRISLPTAVSAGDVLDVERGQPVEDALGQVVVGDERLERLGRGGVAAGHRHAESGQVADHFAERGVLAADAGKIGQAQLVQPEDVLVQATMLQCRTVRRAETPGQAVSKGERDGYDAMQTNCRQA